MADIASWGRARTALENEMKMQLDVLIMSATGVLIVLAVGILIMLAAGRRCGELKRRVAALEEEVSVLRRQLALMRPDSGTAEAIWPRDGFNYLAIGNSLTVHEICKYWWNPVGMAASDAEHDYFHLVQSGLRCRFGTVTARAVGFSEWERTEHDRDQTLAKLDGLLCERLSLVTIQLGENVLDFSTLAEDYVSLIEHVLRKTGGRAQVIVIGDFWKDGTIRAEAAKKCGVDYVSLDEALKEPAKYRSRIGAVVFDAAGNRHIVEHSGVAKHPGDEGMAFIAAKVLEKVRKPSVRR